MRSVILNPLDRIYYTCFHYKNAIKMRLTTNVRGLLRRINLSANEIRVAEMIRHDARRSLVVSYRLK